MRVLGKITAIQPSVEIVKRDGGTYKGARICYVSGGEERKKEIHEKVFDGDAPLKEKVLALQQCIGKEVCLVFKKNGDFTNLKDVLPASEAGKGGDDEFASNKSSGGFSGGGYKRGGASPQDTARIARATAITAAASVSKNENDVVNLAEKYAAFILAPISVDTLGVALSLDTDEVVEEKAVVESGGGSDAKLPF